MMVLTIRSGRDGRFLARVVDQGGRPFVLDYGDSRVIEDLVQRITRGFTMIRQGRLLHVHPGDDDLLVQLASFYAEEGALVFYEEPTWLGRGGGTAPRVVVSATEPEPAASVDLPELDEPTESIRVDDLPSVDEALTTIVPADDAPSCARPGPPAPPDADDADDGLGLLLSAPDVPRGS
jgi:hypothetical protein